MEEYIRLEEEKARRHGRMFNWQTATFGKIENYEDEDDYFIDFETEFPAIVFDNTLTALPSEPTVCPPNENKIDFRISLDESNDEDYTVIFDENSFSYKINPVNDLKTDSGNDNDNMPSSPNLTVYYFDDLDFFKDFENEFPVIVYNDAQTSKSDYLTKPILNPQHIDKFNLNDETSLSEYDKEDQNVLHFNDLFLFDIIHLGDLKSEKDNDNNDIDIIQCSEGNEITHGSNGLSETSHDKIIKTFRTGSFVINLKANIVIWNYYANGMLFFLIINLYVPFGIPFDPKRYYKDGSHTIIEEAKILIQDMAPLPAADQRHPWLRYQVEGYTEGIRHSYEQRLKAIWSRPVNRVHVLDFEGLTPEMRHDLAVRLRMVYTGGEGQQVSVSHAWRRLFGIWVPLVREFILEFLSTCRMSDTEMGLDVADTLCFQLGGDGSNRLIPNKGDLKDYWIEISSDKDFLGPAPSYVLIRDPVRILCHWMIAYSISGRGQAHEKVTSVDLFYLCSMDQRTTNIPHLLAQYLFRHAEGRESGARLSGGHFIGRLAMHFWLVSDKGLRGLQVVTRELLLIDLYKLGRLNICTRFGDIWDWVAHRPERQRAAAAGAYGADEAGSTADEGAQEIPTLAQAPPLPLPAPQPRTMSQRIERIEEEVYDLQRDIVGLRGVIESFTTEQSRVSTWLITCMTQLMDASGHTYQAFDNTLSSRMPLQSVSRPHGYAMLAPLQTTF
ncbi:hypothetical protein Tco_0878493 [Tanacetum coccineum]|uniref:Uncharacterized protein n=1 Tax=Tanacetum coccineum TaxID=301880 RepID=A0ABQ5C0Z7_9ASTR